MMEKYSSVFDSFDKDGMGFPTLCVTHNYSDLPMKGLGKSMDSIGIDEPVIIPQSAILETIIWGYTQAEIERRSYKLQAEIKWMQLPPENTADEPRFKLCFSNAA